MNNVGYRNGRHPIIVGHLVMGLAFIGIVIIWIVATNNDFNGDDLRWLLPLPWLAAGGAGLLVIMFKTRQSYRTPGTTSPTPATDGGETSGTTEMENQS